MLIMKFNELIRLSKNIIFQGLDGGFFHQAKAITNYCHNTAALKSSAGGSI